MSNQVFSNNTDKYYLQNGLNVLTATDSSITQAQNFVKLKWSTQFNQSPNLFEIQPSGDIKILKKGMYNININIQVQDSVNPTTNYIQLKSLIEINKANTGQFTISSNELFVPPSSSAPGAIPSHNTTLQATVFLEVNDTFDIQLRCFTNTGVTFGYTNCVISLF